MIILSQRNPAWGNKKIGSSNSLVKDYGCVITSISMLSSWYNCYHDPGWMAKYLSFQVDKILWKSVTDKLCFSWVWRQYGYDENKIVNSLKGEKTSCILQVYSRHWVVALKKIGNYYWVADPWDGKKKLMHKKYVTGSAHFSS
jgi:hypothetical protein